MNKKRPREPEQELRLRRIYEFERSNYEFTLTGTPALYRLPPHWGGGDAGGPEGLPLPSVWRRLAAQCRRLGIDPDHFLQWGLSLHTLCLEGAPEPNQLLDRRWVEAYRADLRKEKARITLALRVQKGIAREEIVSLQVHHRFSEPQACVNTLLDTWLGLTPLFRHCLARALGGEQFLKIAGPFEDAAAVQFEHNREAYAECWEGFIPDGFPARARLIYNRLLG